MMHDVSLDVEAMEKMKLHLEKYSLKYKYHEELNRKHTRQLIGLKKKVQTILNQNSDYSELDFQFLFETIEHC